MAEVHRNRLRFIEAPAPGTLLDIFRLEFLVTRVRRVEG
jgi:hypothetical protein